MFARGLRLLRIVGYLLMCLVIGTFLVYVLTRASPPSQASRLSPAVTKLLTNDGCTVYRFFDKGAYRYYAKCENSIPTDAYAGGNPPSSGNIATSR